MQHKIYGLIGYPLGHSFSRKYFSEKFHKQKLKNVSYELFELDTLDQLKDLLLKNENLLGLNVTIPFKSEILSHLDEINPEARNIQAVNCVRIERENRQLKLIGFNTDVYGFANSLKPLLKSHHQKAMILGTGGSAKAVAHVFANSGMDCIFVSRNPARTDSVGYDEITCEHLKEYTIVVNTTPLGMLPHTNSKPDIPYACLSERNLLYDLVYNPEKTEFLENGQKYNATIKNGMEMLQLQAEKSWEIWSEKSI